MEQVSYVVLQPTPEPEPPRKTPLDWKGVAVALVFMLFSIAGLFCLGFALVNDDVADRATALVLCAACVTVVVALGRGLATVSGASADKPPTAPTP